jgi:regulator of protease activity HflC (stomatin/prohibitin superfamily)
MSSEQQVRRAAVAVICWMLMTTTSFLIVSLMFSDPIWVLSWTLGLAMIMIFGTLKHFLVGVPEVTGLILINMLIQVQPLDPYANQIVVLVGISFKFPWEQVKEDLFISLRIVAQPFKEDFPAKDGPKIPTTGEIFWRPDERLLPRHIAVDTTIINKGLVAIATGTLSQEISKSAARKARGKVDLYQTLLLDRFEAAITDDIKPSSHEYAIAMAAGVTTVTNEWMWGIDFLGVRIGDADYEADYQKALSQEARASLISQLAEKLREERKLEPKDAMNAALMQFELVKKEIFELEGNAPQALTALLAKWGIDMTGGSGGGRRK